MSSAPSQRPDDPLARVTLEAVLHQLPHAVLVLEAPSGRIALANARAEALMRGPLVQDGAKTYGTGFRIYNLEGRLLAIDELPGMRAVRGEFVEGALLRVERGDGSSVLVQTRAQPMRDAAGQVCAAIVVYEDVTERHALLEREQGARQAAERGEQDIRAVAEAIPQLVWTARPDGTADYFNQRWAEFVGQLPDADQLVWRAAIHPEDRADAERWVSEGRARGEPYEYQYRLRRASDGQYRWLLARAVPVRDAEGNLVRWFGTATDIHDQKQLALRARFLSEASAELASTLDYERTLEAIARLAVPRFADWAAVDLLEPDRSIRRVAVAHVDPDKVELGWELSRRWPARLDNPAGLGKVLRTGEPIFSPDITEAALRASVKDPQAVEAYLALRVRAAIVAPLSVRGRAIGAITLVMAGSDRRYDPGDLELAVELGRRAAIAVENARLYRDAQAANRAKDDFLAVVSHELRTPLTAVLGYTSMLRAGALPEDRRARAIEVIDRNVRAQAQLIEDLLDISRIISGKLRLHVTPLAPADLLEAAVESVRPAADSKGVSLALSLDRAAGPILGDGDRLQQVIWNLLTNAIKFTPAGGQVTAGVTRSDGQVVLAVQDSGQGIAAELLPHVFERFWQADPSSTRSHGGLGLGLAIVRHVVELHGGTVRAFSDGAAKGARFEVTLPLAARAPAVAEARPLTPGTALPPGADALRGRSLLVADDRADAREVLASVLERAGAQVVVVESAAEAMAALGRTRFDALISDVGMPGEDGYHLVRQLRALPPPLGRLPTLALTAYAREEDRTDALAAGFDAHLAKPVEPPELVRVLVELLGRPR